ncbi:MarR family winged helix-turn-helix transcriptional regulator [Dietzia sp. B32]|uniref:MarR family winged helix-turn-helix transcriptional regulator n=1 Tax=Dietzia sp. B32 TaxID=2915130 RepID=UPI0021AD7EB8|nr:MarR family winged helix-turn-helix transcriptional regulator [Dietzia sp. B32]UVE95836.1 MarR family winged helix-turn-helix transcriptional regulator [Dietzia sp. B32]
MASAKVRWSDGRGPAERQLAALFGQLDRQRRALEGAMRLGTADLRLLWLFSDGHARTLKEIAAELGLEQSTVNRQVNAALGSGLLVRSRRPGGSAYEFDRTEEGRRAFEDDAGISLGAYAAALEAMGPADAEKFLALAREFLDHFRGEVDSAGT